MTNSNILTPRQETILRFIIQQVQLKGYPPSVREIGLAVGLQSSSTVHNHLTQLEKKGYIQRDPTKPRAIMLMKNLDGELIGEDAAEEERETFDEMINLPVLGNVAAGMPIYADENIQDTISFPARFIRGNNAFMLKIRGDSMINVGIFDGDYIIVSPQRVASNGDIVVVMIEDEATCKTFYRERSGRIRLQPENDDMEPIYPEGRIEIVGRVTGLFRTMR